MPASITMPHSDVVTQNVDTSPTSSAAQDLNFKIASVKTFWDRDQSPVSNVFESGQVQKSFILAHFNCHFDLKY